MAHLPMLRLLTVSLCLAVTMSAFAQNARWSDFRLLEDQFRSLPVSADTQREDVIRKAADLLTELTPNKKQKLDTPQIKQLVEFLRLTNEADVLNVIMEQNILLIETNQKAMRAEIKKLSPAEAKMLLQSLEVVLSQSNDDVSERSSSGDAGAAASKSRPNKSDGPSSGRMK